MTSPGIIFISGWGAGEESFTLVIDCLRKNQTVKHIPWQHCLEVNTEENELLKRLAEDEHPVMVIAWSLGSLIALQAARRKPEKISALLLISPTARMTGEGEYPGTDRRTLRAMRSRLSKDREGVLADFARLSNSRRIDEEFVSSFLNAAEAIDNADLTAGLCYLEDTDLRNDLSAIA
ncbi:MAG: alpha/beta hydrolase, partial [Planctomycetes bacterium]|nr:alpha/beta hydrolase [Planctomycetota bacterium]